MLEFSFEDDLKTNFVNLMHLIFVNFFSLLLFLKNLNLEASVELKK